MQRERSSKPFAKATTALWSPATSFARASRVRSFGYAPHDKQEADAALDRSIARFGWPTGAEFPDSWPNDDLVSRAFPFPFSLEAIRYAL